MSWCKCEAGVAALKEMRLQNIDRDNVGVMCCVQALQIINR